MTRDTLHRNKGPSESHESRSQTGRDLQAALAFPCLDNAGHSLTRRLGLQNLTKTTPGKPGSGWICYKERTECSGPAFSCWIETSLPGFLSVGDTQRSQKLPEQETNPSPASGAHKAEMPLATPRQAMRPQSRCGGERLPAPAGSAAKQELEN